MLIRPSGVSCSTSAGGGITQASSPESTGSDSSAASRRPADVCRITYSSRAEADASPTIPMASSNRKSGCMIGYGPGAPTAPMNVMIRPRRDCVKASTIGRGNRPPSMSWALISCSSSASVKPATLITPSSGNRISPKGFTSSTTEYGMPCTSRSCTVTATVSLGSSRYSWYTATRSSGVGSVAWASPGGVSRGVRIRRIPPSWASPPNRPTLVGSMKLFGGTMAQPSSVESSKPLTTVIHDATQSVRRYPMPYSLTPVSAQLYRQNGVTRNPDCLAAATVSGPAAHPATSHEM